MTAVHRTALRARNYTYYEMLAFAQFYSEHRNENSPEQLLNSFLRWKQTEGSKTFVQQRLMFIEEIACKFYGQSLADVRGKRRYLDLVRCRQVIAYLSVKWATQHTVAGCLGGDRNNIQYSKTKCGELMEVEALLRHEVHEIEARLAKPLAAIEEAQRQIENENENDDRQIEADPRHEGTGDNPTPDVDERNAAAAKNSTC